MGGGGGTPYNGLYWEAPKPKRDTFFRRKVYERVSEISLVVVHESDMKSVLSVNKWLRDSFNGCEKVEKLFWFCDLFIFLRQCCEMEQASEMPPPPSILSYPHSPFLDPTLPV